MTKRYVWVGSTGPFTYDDTRDLKDPTGSIPAGTKEAAITTTGQLKIQGVGDEDEAAIRVEDLEALEALSYFFGAV